MGALGAHLQNDPNRRLRHRCQAMLMAARGRRHHHIAVDLGISPRTLQRWLQAYQTHGLDGLTMQWAPGRTPHTLLNPVIEKTDKMSRGMKSRLRDAMALQLQTPENYSTRVGKESLHCP